MRNENAILDLSLRATFSAAFPRALPTYHVMTLCRARPSTSCPQVRIDIAPAGTECITGQAGGDQQGGHRVHQRRSRERKALKQMRAHRFQRLHSPTVSTPSTMTRTPSSRHIASMCRTMTWRTSS
jgi:hypothetical protein